MFFVVVSVDWLRAHHSSRPGFFFSLPNYCCESSIEFPVSLMFCVSRVCRLFCPGGFKGLNQLSRNLCLFLQLRLNSCLVMKLAVSGVWCFVYICTRYVLCMYVCMTGVASVVLAESCN